MHTKLDKWSKKRRFVVSRVLKPEKERAQLSLLEGSEYNCFFFVTNTDLESEAVVISYEKRGNSIPNDDAFIQSVFTLQI